MSVTGARVTIEQQVMSWEGGIEYRLGRRELGHVHGDHLVDIPFPTKVRDQLVAEGRAEPHHILPDSGWVSFYLRDQQDIVRAIDLFRLSFELATKQRAQRSNHDESDEDALD